MQDVLNILIKKGESKDKSIRRSKNDMKKFIDLSNKLGCKTYFITFTFKEEFTPLTINSFKKRNFIRYLRNFNNSFYLHADYGKEKNRFHLHGVVCSFEDLPRDKIFNKYGFVNINDLDIKKINYIIKYSTKFNFETFRAIKINNFKKMIDKYIK